MANGDKTNSQFISHATSYPVVKDSIETVKSNPYGKKSIEIADGAYQRVQPYLETPYSYVKPYVEKADEVAANGLRSVDQRFPIVKEDTHTVIDTAKSYVFWPYNYVYDTYNDEYRKTANHKDRGQGFYTFILAIISTELKIASDGFQFIANFLGPKYEESKKKGSDYIRQAEESAEHYKKVGQDKLNDYTKLGQQKADEYTSTAQQKGQEVKGQAEQTKEQAKSQAQQTKEEAKAKSGQK